MVKCSVHPIPCLTCIQDTSTFLSHSWAAGRTPNQNTAERKSKCWTTYSTIRSRQRGNNVSHKSSFHKASFNADWMIDLLSIGLVWKTDRCSIFILIWIRYTHQDFGFYANVTMWYATWTCLQSCPRAGSWMRLKVTGHLRETLMAVCSTPSSPFRVALPAEAATLLKFLLTDREKRERKEREKKKERKKER